MCTFAHGEHEIGTVPGDMMEEPPPPDCGDTIILRTICKFWQEGSCREGPQCTFAHGEHEIGTAVGSSSFSRRDPPPMRQLLVPTRSAAAPMALPGPGGDAPVRRSICKFWEASTCREEPGQCSFAHGEREIGTAPRPPSRRPLGASSSPTAAAAPPWRGTLGIPSRAAPAAAALPCRPPGAPEEAKAVRRTLCKFFQAGACTKSAFECSWAHGEQDIGTPIGSSAAPKRSMPACRFYASGGCNKGRDCPFPHADDDELPSAKRFRSG